MNRFPIFGALILGAALALPGISHAQTTKEQAKAKEDKKLALEAIESIETAQIPVRNLASNVMAYWLNPNHQPMPLQIQISQRNAGNLYRMGIGAGRQAGNGNGPDNFKLPEGIQGLFSVDPQNILRVRGTKTGIEALQKLVKEIDVPLNEVEIEAQIWEMSPATFQSLPLVFRDTSKPGDTKITRQIADKKQENETFNTDFLSRVALAAPTSNLAPTTQILEASLKDKSARLLMTPRVTVVDGLVATAQTNESRALVFDDRKSGAPQTKSKINKEETPPIDNAGNAGKDTFPEGIAFINSQTGMTVAPVLHGDVVSLTFSITLEGSATQAATTLRDGQTLAVRLPNANPTTGWPRVALIKAQIIRRASENVIVPGK